MSRPDHNHLLNQPCNYTCIDRGRIAKSMEDAQRRAQPPSDAPDAPVGANEKLGLPRGKMETHYYAFDIDGTLRDNTVDQNIAPVANEDIRTLLIILRRSFKNIRIIVWSGSGELYARQVGASFGLDPYVSHYMSKTEYKAFTDKNVTAVDDIQDTALGNIANLIVRMK